MLPALFVLAVVGATVRDDARGFSLDVPAGYEQAPVTPPALYTFMRGAPGGADFAALSLSELGGTLAPGSKTNHTIVESSAREAAGQSGATISRFDYRTAQWQGLELELMVTRITVPAGEMTSAALQVPLKRGAVQLMVVGPAANEAALLKDLGAVLGSLAGETNWPTEAERDRKAGVEAGLSVGLGAGALIAVWLVRRRARRAAAPTQP